MTKKNPQLFFNGINSVTGDYDMPPMTGDQLVGFISGERQPENLKELRFRHAQLTQKHLGVKEGATQKSWISPAGALFLRTTRTRFSKRRYRS